MEHRIRADAVVLPRLQVGWCARTRRVAPMRKAKAIAVREANRKTQQAHRRRIPSYLAARLNGAA
jgi:hypothetical protein